MTEDEGHGQQYVAHDGCDQALEVGGLDLKDRAKSQPSEQEGGDFSFEGATSQSSDEPKRVCVSLTYSSKPRPTTEKWPMW